MNRVELRQRVVQLVPIILDMWKQGHSASDIARTLELPSHKVVTRVVEKARSIGDRRAVLHKYACDRLIGRPGRDGTCDPKAVTLNRTKP